MAPLWTTQHWFSKLTRMIADCPFLLPMSPDTLKLPQMDVTHPLPRLQLPGLQLSGDPSKPSRFCQTLLTSHCPHGGRPPADSITPICVHQMLDRVSWCTEHQSTESIVTACGGCARHTALPDRPWQKHIK